MGLLADCEELFDAKTLYEVLEVEKDAKQADIKKAYRKLSLKYHPDRHVDCDQAAKDLATRRFQTLSKVHLVLSDDEKRTLYDTSGIIASDDSLDQSEADWVEYWRLLFPKVTTKDIESFMEKYIGSEDEKNDVRKAYLKYEGDMDKISESVIAFDEQRTRSLIKQLIKDEQLEAFDTFVHEPKSKREKRIKRALKEAKLAEKEQNRKSDESFDLVQAIKARNEGSFNSLMASLESKYANAGSGSSKRKRKK